MPFTITTKAVLVSSFFWVAAFLLYLAFHLWGLSLVNDVYYGTSFSFLNEAIERRDSHSLDFYLAKAERFVYTTIIFTLLLSSVPLVYPFTAPKVKAALKPPQRHNETLTFLGLLVITDLFFIILHVFHSNLGLPTSGLFSIGILRHMIRHTQ